MSPSSSRWARACSPGSGHAEVASACVSFADVLLIEASHVVEPRDEGGSREYALPRVVGGVTARLHGYQRSEESGPFTW